MIPKKIHYCWFGRNPLPESALKCIASWRKYLPDYEIIEWNEDNFDVDSIPYTAQAYQAKKYAFVSDYARFKILYEHGGIYFDTDVEVIKPIDDIIAKGPFMGFEINPCAERPNGAVNPGLGLGVGAGHDLYKEIIDAYGQFQFMNTNGELNQTTVVIYTSNILIKKGLTAKKGIQQVDGIFLYPKEYFNPLDDNTGRLVITENTHSIHWYSKTWLNVSPLRMRFSRFAHRIFGTDTVSNLMQFLKKKQ